MVELGCFCSRSSCELWISVVLDSWLLFFPQRILRNSSVCCAHRVAFDCGWRKGFWENSNNEDQWRSLSVQLQLKRPLFRLSCQDGPPSILIVARRRGKHRKTSWNRCFWMCWNFPKRQQTEMEVGRGSMPCSFNVWRVVERTTNEFRGSSHLEIAFIAWW